MSTCKYPARALIVAGVIALATLLFTSWQFSLSPLDGAKKLGRVAAVNILALSLSSDLEDRDRLLSGYYVGKIPHGSHGPQKSWEQATGILPFVVSSTYKGTSIPVSTPPFIFENYDEEHVKQLREELLPPELLRSFASEYQHMLHAAAWVGGLWDHGTDRPKQGANHFKANDLLLNSDNNAYHCEVSARALSQVATAMGWPSRVLTVSRDGYSWQHAVTEIWSNQFNKWALFDPDFNVVYELNSIPLSAFELVHQSEQLKKSPSFNVRQFAPLKPFFVHRGGTDNELRALRELFLYNYIHYDLRNDWASRQLRGGSPAGGDLSTVYTHNASIDRVLNAFEKSDHIEYFNWPLNIVELYFLDIQPEGTAAYQLEIAISSYAPYGKSVELSLNNGKWQRVDADNISLRLRPGQNQIEARLSLEGGGKSPVTAVQLTLD